MVEEYWVRGGGGKDIGFRFGARFRVGPRNFGSGGVGCRGGAIEERVVGARKEEVVYVRGGRGAWVCFHWCGMVEIWIWVPGRARVGPGGGGGDTLVA